MQFWCVKDLTPIQSYPCQIFQVSLQTATFHQVYPASHLTEFEGLKWDGFLLHQHILLWSFAVETCLQDMRLFLEGVYTAGSIKMQMPAGGKGWWLSALAILEATLLWRSVDLQTR